MQSSSLLMRKQHLKKNPQTKYVNTYEQHLQNAALNHLTLVKTSPKNKVKKTKPRQKSLQTKVEQPRKANTSTFSSKRTQSTGLTARVNPPTKRSTSIRKKSPTKNKSDKHKKKFHQYVSQKSQTPIIAVQGIETSKSFFPLTHEEKEKQQIANEEESKAGLKSYLIAEEQDLHDEESDDVTDTLERAADLPFDSGLVGEIPQSFKDFYHKSRAESPEKQLDKSDWEALETLRIKNEELSNYIEELEMAEQQLQQENEKIKRNLQQKHSEEKKKLLAEIAGLKDEQVRLANTNVNLQQMFNEGKQNLDLMTNKYQELLNIPANKNKETPTVQADDTGRVKELELELSKQRKCLEVLRMEKVQFEKSLTLSRREKEEQQAKKVNKLQLQLQKQRKDIEQLRLQKVQYQNDLTLCRQQKQEIKAKAEQVIAMLKKTNQSESEQDY